MSFAFLRPARLSEATMSDIEEIAAEQLQAWLAQGMTPAEICAAVGEPWFGVSRCTAGKALDDMVTAYRLAVLESPPIALAPLKEDA
jgi:hypothetical protein